MPSTYLVETSRMAVKQTKRGLMMYNRNDLFVGRSLDLYGEWTELEILQMEQMLRPGDTVIDVGANIGTHAVALAKIVGRTGVVHAFEPQRPMFYTLCGNVALNALDNVICHHRAVGSAAGEALIPRGNQDRPDNFAAVHLNAGTAADSDAVPVVTLDSLNLQECRLIKADVEGMEPDVLKGAADTIRRLRPFLYIECHDPRTSRDTISLIFEYGYRAWWHICGYYNEYNFFGCRENVFGGFMPAGNLLCIPADRGSHFRGLPECTSVDDTWQDVLRRLRDAQTAA
jgi:FkbM family methyltransferase